MTKIEVVDTRLAVFTMAMRFKLASQRNQDKEDWREMKPWQIRDRIHEELEELDAVFFSGLARSSMDEVVDVANFCFMLWDLLNYRSGKLYTQEEREAQILWDRQKS